MPVPGLTEIVETLQSREPQRGRRASWRRGSTRSTRPGAGRCLKLVTGSLRIGVSARLAKMALAQWGGVEIDRIEEVWHGLSPPYRPLFDWLEGRPAAARNRRPAEFLPADAGAAARRRRPLQPRPAPITSPNGNGTASACSSSRAAARSGSIRAPATTSAGPSPTSSRRCRTEVTLDGELLVMRDGEVAPFNDLQQRLNRKSPSEKMLHDYPGGGAALRHAARGRRGSARPAFCRAARGGSKPGTPERRGRALDLSPLVPFASWDELQRIARRRPRPRHRGDDAEARAIRSMSPAGRRARGSSGSAAR